MLNLDKKECHINSNKENKGKMELSTEQQLSLYQISKDFKKSVWEETLQNVSFKREKKKIILTGPSLVFESVTGQVVAPCVIPWGVKAAPKHSNNTNDLLWCVPCHLQPWSLYYLPCSFPNPHDRASCSSL